MNPIKTVSFPVAEMDIPVKPVHVDPGSIDSSMPLQRKLGEIVRAIQEAVGVKDIRLDYSVNRANGQIIVKVIDGKSGKTIREIPPSELVALAEAMKEFEGVLFDESI